jgi:hypothetical protein
MTTQEWLDPSISCSGALGEGPVAQCQGPPDSAPIGATAACTYVGGVEVRSADGALLVIATLPFPMTLYVSGFPRSGTIDSANYLNVPLGAG